MDPLCTVQIEILPAAVVLVQVVPIAVTVSIVIVPNASVVVTL